MEDRKEILRSFEKWLRNGRKSKGTANNYCCWLGSVQTDICSYIRGYKWKKKKDDSYEYSVSQFAKKTLYKPYDFIVAITALLQEGDWFYSMAIVNAMCYMANLCKDVVPKSDMKSFNNKCSALNSFRLYISSMQFTEGHQGKYETQCNEYRENIDDDMLPKIDGFKGLIDELEIDSPKGKETGEAIFIKYAIEQSYFFHPEIVEKRMSEIRNSFVSGKEALPARGKGRNKDYNKDTYTDEAGIEMLVKIDPDNNKNVRDLISENTGYTIGAYGLVRNYIISHLWGRASDPRYFTNLWNVAIVPAWANSLLDKNDKNSRLAAMFKATIMKVAKELYGLTNRDTYWEDLKMSEPRAGNIEKDATYRVRLLCRRKPNQKLGAIVIKTVKIRK